jgi:dTMP kinase
MSLFITFEGGEGCGKSTQARVLLRNLDRAGIPAILVHEPGGTSLGEKIRSLLKKTGSIAISPLAELMLFNASRSQIVEDIIRPALEQGKIVICDRFTDSTIAYQHYGRGLELKIVKEVNRIAARGLNPDLTFLLDIPPEEGMARKQDADRDRFMQEDLAFHARVRDGFIRMACEEHRRWLMIDAHAPKKAISSLIWERVCMRLGTKAVRDRESLRKQIRFPYQTSPNPGHRG